MAYSRSVMTANEELLSVAVIGNAVQLTPRALEGKPLLLLPREAVDLVEILQEAIAELRTRGNLRPPWVFGCPVLLSEDFPEGRVRLASRGPDGEIRIDLFPATPPTPTHQEAVLRVLRDTNAGLARLLEELAALRDTAAGLADDLAAAE